MWTPKDEALLKVAGDLGYLTPEQCGECRAGYDAVAKSGAQMRLARLLLDKGTLTRNQLTQVNAELRKRGVHPSVGHYDLLKLLGTGGSASVYRAVDTRDRRVVAVKVLAAALAAQAKSVQRFLRGAELAAMVKHPHVAATFESGKAGAQYYLAMEYVEGPSLTQKARQGPIPEAEAQEIIAQVAEGLAACHARGIVHRDVKPSNIIVGPTGAKLLDLGLAREAEATLHADVTLSGHALGTPHYMSPEQCASSREVDHRADIYSLGATLFFAVTGRPPFSGDTLYEIMKQQATERVPDPRQFNPNVSDATYRLIYRMMMKNPAQRMQTAQQVADMAKQLRQVTVLRPVRAAPGVEPAAPAPNELPAGGQFIHNAPAAASGGYSARNDTPHSGQSDILTELGSSVTEMMEKCSRTGWGRVVGIVVIVAVLAAVSYISVRAARRAEHRSPPAAHSVQTP